MNVECTFNESFCPTNIPDTRAPNNMIGVFWRDLDPSEEGKISYEDLGDRFVVSWQDVPLYGRTEKETFQAILHYDGRIVFQYKSLQGVDEYIKVGIENSQGRNGVAIPLASIRDGKAYELNLIVTKIESPPAQKVTITSRTSYVYGNGQLTARLQEEPLGSPVKPYYYHNDHLGSARVISDKDGKVVEQIFYYPFGGGGPVGGPTFTGKELDDSGLFYFGARYYDPALGRFISPDPVQVPGDNLYVYCANNPLRYVDPDGEWFIPFLITVFKVYSAASTIYNIYEGYKYGGLEGALQAGMVSAACWMITSGIDFGNELWQDMAEGALGGAISGGISAAVYGGDFGKAMYQGAAWGAAGGAFGHWLEKKWEAYQSELYEEASNEYIGSLPKWAADFGGEGGYSGSIVASDAMGILIKTDNGYQLLWTPKGKELMRDHAMGMIGGGYGGTIRNITQRGNFLKSSINKSGSWMKQWLSKGKVPPGYQVDHIKPLSIGGKDIPENMRLKLKMDHIRRHIHYRPWIK
ncbi:MAG: RHS repeat-associated core domain-containing protein [bacterium]